MKSAMPVNGYASSHRVPWHSELTCASSNHAQGSRAHHRAGPIPDIELSVDVVEVPFERAFRDEDGLGDFLVAEAGL
jgi:hypothetical protein